jgi:hypothetical protein
VARVFRAKLEELRRWLLQNDILSKVRAYVCAVEFQRGLPHAHWLLIKQRKYKIMRPVQYDMPIFVDLPNKKFPKLYRMVTKHMMHGPCGVLNLECPSSHAQRIVRRARIVPATILRFNIAIQGLYPLYKRCDDGSKEMI